MEHTAEQPRKVCTRGAKSFYVYRLAFVAAMGGVLFGFDTAVINGAIVFLKRYFALSDGQTEWAAGSLLVGCALGAALAGTLSDRFGRKKLLLAAAGVFFISAIGASLPHHLLEFVSARILGGIAIGVVSMLSPLYIAEISPAGIRGGLITLNQLAIVSGVLLAFCVNYALSGQGANNWRWMFASAALPSFLFLISLVTVPESPRWLIQNGRAEEAQGIIGRMLGSEEARKEVAQIQKVIREEDGLTISLFEPTLRKPFTIAIALAVLQQITGINTILYYGSLILIEKIPQQSEATSFFANVLIGVVNFLCTIIAMLFVDRVGRKPLLMLASGGMGISLTLLSISIWWGVPSWVALPLILLYVACFAVGLGPGVWIVISELFPTRVRGRAMSVTTVCLWLACLLITSTFLSLLNVLTVAGGFLVYALLSFLTLIFVWIYTPETKAKTLEEIELSWKKA